MATSRSNRSARPRSKSTKPRLNSDQTHPSAFLEPMVEVEYGVRLGDEAIPLVICNPSPLLRRGVGPLDRSTVASIALALMKLLRPNGERDRRTVWADSARADMVSRRL